MRTRTSRYDDSAEGALDRSRTPRAGTPASRAQSLSSQVLDLQRLAGNAAATQAIAAARPPGAPGRDAPPSAAPVVTVQRKVGFEFESSPWSPWRLLVGRRAADASQDGGAAVEPAARKAVLEHGAGFTLEADDTPGPTESNLEFVTDPFDETPAGLSHLHQALDEMLGIAARLDKHVGRPGPNQAGAPPYPITADRLSDHFVVPEEHGFGGSAGLPGTDVVLSGGEVGFPVRMQSTAGLPLADLPEMMMRLGRDVPNETAAEQDARKRGRATTWPSDRQPLRAHRIIGAAPDQARITMDNLRKDPRYAAALAGDTRDMSGFVAALVMYVAVLQAAAPPDKLIKNRLMLMPRNGFLQMFRSLPDDQQAAVRTSPDVLVDELLRATRTFYTGELSDETAVIPRPNRPTPADRAMTTLTVGEWIRGLADGRDYFSQPGMQQWLAGRTDFGADAKRAAVEAMESIGTYSDDERRAGTGEHLFKFENRWVRPNGTGRLSMAAAAENALEIFRMYTEIRTRT